MRSALSGAPKRARLVNKALHSGRVDGMQGMYEEAYRLLDSPRSRAAFDLDEEPESLRDRYGRHRAGQACLLARRLVEVGVPWVTVDQRSPGMMPGAAESVPVVTTSSAPSGG